MYCFNLGITLFIINLCCFYMTEGLFECNPHNETLLEETWQKFKIYYNKTYTGKLEQRRKKAWRENCGHIYKHNLEAKNGKHSFELRLNHISDLTPDTYQKKMIKLLKSIRRKLYPEMVGISHLEKIRLNTQEIDWRKKGFITPSENQENCGSCYAFSIAYVLQAQLLIKKNISMPLSEQQIIDCSSKTGNYGCNGGSLRNTLRYIEKVGGLQSAADYSYQAKTTKCHYRKDKIAVKLADWAVLPTRNEHILAKTVANIGPVAVSVNASPRTFQLYHNGIYDDEKCTSKTVNHAMVVVGYTKDSWILKNWWSDQWGEEGYMRIRRHRNRCGISNYAAYALID